MTDRTGLNLHADEALFREAVNFTASRTGFSTRLIEKDYFRSVLLSHLAQHGGDQLVFKGGTCLAKVHAGFYRLSEDLDFAISVPVSAGRTQRSHAVAETKRAVAHLAHHLPVFTTAERLTGANNSTQYNGAVAYQSPASGQQEHILIEVSLREPLLLPAMPMPAKTLLLDPITDQALAPNVEMDCILMLEAMAEKLRATLSRREVAIRDFYDLDYAVQRLNLDPTDERLAGLLREKLAVPGNAAACVCPERFAPLRRQLHTRLRPVLREEDFVAFDLDRAIQLVVAIAETLVDDRDDSGATR
jgi:predicted nucleotidyltransferase component of viral defense system